MHRIIENTDLIIPEYILQKRKWVVDVSLMLSLIFTRLSTPEMYGQYQYIVSILGVIALFSLPGMNVAIVRASAQGFDRTLWEGTKTRLRFAFLGSVALAVIAGLLAYQGRPAMARAALISAVLFPLLSPLDSYLSYLNGKRQFRHFAGPEKGACRPRPGWPWGL